MTIIAHGSVNILNLITGPEGSRFVLPGMSMIHKTKTKETFRLEEKTTNCFPGDQ